MHKVCILFGFTKKKKKSNCKISSCSGLFYGGGLMKKKKKTGIRKIKEKWWKRELWKNPTDLPFGLLSYSF